METFSTLLAICAGNSPVTGEFLSQRPVTQSFHIFVAMRMTTRLSKQSHWLWRHCNGYLLLVQSMIFLYWIFFALPGGGGGRGWLVGWGVGVACVVGVCGVGWGVVGLGGALPDWRIEKQGMVMVVLYRYILNSYGVYICIYVKYNIFQIRFYLLQYCISCDTLYNIVIQIVFEIILMCLWAKMRLENNFCTIASAYMS